jgi:KDO2-lipid IV(A) lauroyltransferase
LNVKRIKRGFYEAELVRVHENPKELPDFELTALYFQMLEKMIVSQPELYLWTHNRFKYAKRE